MSPGISPVMLERIFWSIFTLETLVVIVGAFYVFAPGKSWGPEGPVGAWLLFLPPLILAIAAAVFLATKSPGTRIAVTIFLAFPLVQAAIGPLYSAIREMQLNSSLKGNDEFRGPKRTLANAIHSQNLAEVQRLIPLSGDLNESSGGETLLRFALVNATNPGTAGAANSLAIVKALLDAGANPNVPAYGSNWPVTLAIMNGAAMTELLVRAGADINRLDGASRPLWWNSLSITTQGLDTLHVLLANKADVRLRHAEGGPVGWAAHYKNWPAVLLLIQKGAEWKEEGQFGQPVVQILQSDLQYKRASKSEISAELEELIKLYGLS